MTEGNESVTAITYGGQALARAIRRTSGTSSSDTAVEIWYLAGPNVGKRALGATPS